jgi:3-dehydroquinate synthase
MSAITIRSGALRDAGALISEIIPPGTAAIIADDNVMPLYGETLESALAGAGWTVVRRAFPHGEANKTVETYASIVNFLAENGLTRTDAVVALGGGVTGDMAGFAAATYLRGVKLVQVPTTLLACVDSSVGGKTAVDLPAGKNLLGAFYQPHAVLIDPLTLSTLPDAIFRDGMAEVIKHGAIRDADLFNHLPYVRENLDAVIARNVAIKKSVVELDERDTGIRQILNFGHTFGHAIEKLSNYEISHGSAVAMGMAVMARACAKRGLCAAEARDELIRMIQAFALPTECPYGAEEMFSAMLLDKKRAGDKITLVVLREIGRCELFPTTLSDARAFLEEGIAP